MKIGILGASGIGYHHARIFKECGCEVKSILGSTQKSAQITQKNLEEKLGIKPEVFTNIDRLLESDLDAISICTPPQYHYDQIISSFNYGLPVFCEKPLFWEDRIGRNRFNNKIRNIQGHHNRNILVNTSNATLLDAVRTSWTDAASIKKFKFIFHTNGHSRFKGILTDLAPHANSLLIKMLGIQNIRNCNIQISEHRVKCSFSYGETHVEYYLVEEQECKKRLEFIINDRKFRRLQKGYGDSYEVYLHDVFNDNIIEIQDPFRVFIERFVLSCKNETVCEFDEIKSNMQLMYDLLFQ